MQRTGHSRDVGRYEEDPKDTSSYSRENENLYRDVLAFNDVAPGSSVDLSSVVDLRNQIQGLLTLSERSMPNRSNYDETNENLNSSASGARHQPLNGDSSMLSYVGGSTSGYFGLRDALPLSSQYIVPLVGGGVGGGSGSGGHHHRPDVASLLAENHALTDTLEQQRFKRKHCEKQIQMLQGKVLGLQQDLTVAVSTDRKKDIMLEQFDRALAKIVEGWRQKDADRQSEMRHVCDENSTLREAVELQRQLAVRFEKQLQQTVQALQAEQQRAERMCGNKDAEVVALSADRAVLQASLEREREQWRHIVDTERNGAAEERERAHKEVTELRSKEDEERRSWQSREAGYLCKMEEMAANQRQTLDVERKKRDEQEAVHAELQVALRASQNTVELLEMEVNTVNREKDSLKVEMGLSEARLESSRRMMEADLAADAQRQLSIMTEEAERHLVESEQRIHEAHRRQIHELTLRHRDEVSELDAEHQTAVAWLEEKHRQHEGETEERLMELERTVAQLKEENRTVNLHKAEITNQLQMMMQAHCAEAMRLLQLNRTTSASSGGTVAGGGPMGDVCFGGGVDHDSSGSSSMSSVRPGPGQQGLNQYALGGALHGGESEQLRKSRGHLDDAQSLGNTNDSHRTSRVDINNR